MMKRMTKILGAIALSTVIFSGSVMVTCAQSAERSYTYNYDYWGDVQDSPDFYNVTNVYTSVDFGLDVKLKNPEGMYVVDDLVYVCDTGNNRIVVLQRQPGEKFTTVQIIDKIKNCDVDTLSGPTDIAISDEGNIFIADKGNNRVVKVDKDLNFICEFVKPKDEPTLDPSLTFVPDKITIDTAERVYCIATGINKGFLKYEKDGTFSQFVGATNVTYNFYDYLWKKFATQEQRALMENFVPTEYDNLYMDHEGFIYAVCGTVEAADLRSGDADAVRRINLMGNDILVQNGEYPCYGDLYMGDGGGYTGPSYFSDVTCFENDVYVCLDKNRGRLFAYDDQGKMVFACGGNGNMDGYFRNPKAIEHMGYDLLVLDTLDNSITMFTVTDFGRLVFDAMDQFDEGNYDQSEASWREVMAINGNYDLAYIGIGRSLLRQEKYEEAMDYFELKYDDDNYSKAYKQYRKEWVEKNIVIIIAVLLVLFLVPTGIGKMKSIKREIDTADIFKS